MLDRSTDYIKREGERGGGRGKGEGEDAVEIGGN